MSPWPSDGPRSSLGDGRLPAAVLAAATALTAAKLFFAARTPLFVDEAFYWQCSQRLALAYFDHPPLTAILVRAGTALLGPTPLGVRLPFLLCGAGLLAVLYWTARPLVGRRAALLTVAVAMTLPGLALMGTFAIPDAPLLLWSALAVLALERALSTGRLHWWLLGGVAGALGLLTEYRFATFALAAAIVLLATARGRRAWRGPGPWLMAGISLVGLLPALLFNLEFDFTPIQYQLFERHEGAGPGITKHLRQQLVVTTPLLYAALVATLGVLVARGRRGDEDATVAGLLALLPLGFWLALSPFTDDSHADAHWPLSGYLPLLPFVPGVLRALAARGRAAAALAIAAPALGGAVLATVLVVANLPSLSQRPLRQFLGWEEMGRELGARLAAWEGERPVVVFDNYFTASHAEFLLARDAPAALAASPWYVLDHAINRHHHRSPQYALWERGAEALVREAGRPALVVVEVDRGEDDDHPAWMAYVRSLAPPLELVGELHAGREERPRRFRFYTGRVAGVVGRP